MRPPPNPILIRVEENERVLNNFSKADDDDGYLKLLKGHLKSTMRDDSMCNKGYDSVKKYYKPWLEAT